MDTVDTMKELREFLDSDEMALAMRKLGEKAFCVALWGLFMSIFDRLEEGGGDLDGN